MKVQHLVAVMSHRQRLLDALAAEAEILRCSTSEERRSVVLRNLEAAEARLIRFDNLSVEEAAKELL